MRIAPEHVESKQIAGSTKDGSPIVYVVTKGGLHALFTKDEGSVVTLGAAPHKAVAVWLAEKKSPGIKWEDEFRSGEVRKSEMDMFVRLRNHLFCQHEQPLGKSEQLDAFIVYNTFDKSIMVMHEDEIRKSIPAMRDAVDGYIIRPIDLSEPVTFLRYHRFYKEVHG